MMFMWEMVTCIIETDANLRLSSFTVSPYEHFREKENGEHQPEFQGRIQKRIVYTGRLSGAGDRDGVRTQSVHGCSLAYFNKPSF